MHIRRPFASLTAAALLFCTGCTAHYADNPAPPTAEVGPALWQVKDEDTTVYLFGTVHALPPGTQWYRGKIARAFSESDELVTEVDMTKADSFGVQLAVAGTLPQGQNLRRMMSEDDQQAFEMALVSLGLPIEALDDKQPWLAAMMLSLVPALHAGYDQASGVEMALLEQGKDKKHAGLETVEDQIDVFNGMPQDAQFRYLRRVVDGVSTSVDTLDTVVANWLAGNAYGLANAMNAEMGDPVLYDRLLTQRNAKWAAWIDARMEEPGTVFVAVGAGHLSGKNSVQDQLKGRRLSVTRVWE